MDHISPAGAEIRVLQTESKNGSLVHCTLKAGQRSNAVMHHTVFEIWHVISGQGKIWIWDNGEIGSRCVLLKPGITISIECKTTFQYQSSKKQDLVFLCFTTPRWPGPHEATIVSHL